MYDNIFLVMLDTVEMTDDFTFFCEEVHHSWLMQTSE